MKKGYFYHYRKIVHFLYEGSDPGSSKGKSSCTFTLQSVFDKLLRNNASAQSDLADQRIDKNTNLNETLTTIQSTSRGKCLYYQGNITS